jgi:2-keto-myo-inositol isomerase
MNADLLTDIVAAAAAGFKALEIWAEKLDSYLEGHSQEQLKALLDRQAIIPASINSIEFITFRTPEDYRHIRSRCRELSRRAQYLGCDTIVVVPSPTPEGGASAEQVTAESVRVLRDLASVAAGYGVRLAFEFLGFSWCSVRTLKHCVEIVQETNHPGVGLVLDTCHFHAGGSSLRSIEAVPRSKLLIFHINDVEDRPLGTIEDAHRLLPGEGAIPLDDILLRLKRIRYDGLCSVELFRPEYWQRSPEELMTAARAAALQVLEPYFEVE